MVSFHILWILVLKRRKYQWFLEATGANWMSLQSKKASTPFQPLHGFNLFLRRRPNLTVRRRGGAEKKKEGQYFEMVSGSGIRAKVVVVDARHHMLGRLSSIIAKELLNGQKVVVLRSEEICLSGGLVRQKMKYLRFLRKRMNTKPSHGPIHFRAPAKILWRTIRGMIPHKTKRGALALGRLKAYEGVPPPYDKMKRVVIPDALKVLRLQPGHKYCLLGRLSKEVGWGYADTVKELEEKRKQRALVSYEKRKQLAKLRLKAESAAEGRLGDQLDILTPIKY